MRIHWILCVFLTGGCALLPAASLAQSCSEAWYQEVESAVQSGDGQGHGPDVGSEEWMSVIEFKLGIRGEPGLPAPGTEDWCAYIDDLLSARNAAGTSGPSFSCNAVRSGSVEALICEDAQLASLDRKMSEVYTEALQMAANEHPPNLKAEQRGWIKGRNECWKREDRRDCVAEAYTRRIAELQARYRLVPCTGPVFFACDGNPAREVAVTYFETDPPTLIAEYGDSTSLMYARPSGSGTRYEGRNEMLWAHRGEAVIRWGYEAPDMRCLEKPGGRDPD